MKICLLEALLFVLRRRGTREKIRMINRNGMMKLRYVLSILYRMALEKLDVIIILQIRVVIVRLMNIRIFTK